MLPCQMDNGFIIKNSKVYTARPNKANPSHLQLNRLKMLKLFVKIEENTLI